jgi:hypothetical protein
MKRLLHIKRGAPFMTRLELMLELAQHHARQAIKRRVMCKLGPQRRARAVLCRWVRRKRNVPVNKQDPIMLDELHEPLFRYVTPGTSPRVYVYNLEPLLRYVLTSGRFVDPMSGIAYTELEVWRLNKLKTAHHADLEPQVDLMRLAFDEDYRMERALMSSARELTSDRARSAITELVEALQPENIARTLTRYVRICSELVRAHLHSASLLDSRNAVTMAEDMVRRLQAQGERCPPTVLEFAQSALDTMHVRQREGWRLEMVPTSSRGATDEDDTAEVEFVIVSSG